MKPQPVTTAPASAQSVIHRATHQAACPVCGRIVVIDHETTTEAQITVRASHFQTMDPACRWVWETYTEGATEHYRKAAQDILDQLRRGLG